MGMRIHHGISTRWIKPCLMELGGKNSCIVMPSADLDAAAEGAMKSAFGLQNQKCSATSRVYVHEDVAKQFIALLVSKTKEFVFAKAGDPSKALTELTCRPMSILVQLSTRRPSIAGPKLWSAPARREQSFVAANASPVSPLTRATSCSQLLHNSTSAATFSLRNSSCRSWPLGL